MTLQLKKRRRKKDFYSEQGQFNQSQIPWLQFESLIVQSSFRDISVLVRYQFFDIVDFVSFQF